MIELKRVDNWRERLKDAAYEIRNDAFVWGSNDCMTMVRKLALALTDTDVTKGQFKSYKTAAGAFKQMKIKGFDSLGDAVASVLPEIKEGPSHAGIGDVVTIPDDSQMKQALGVVISDRVLVLRNNGIGTVDLLDADRAFRIG